jgi:hypothetical protein
MTSNEIAHLAKMFPGAQVEELNGCVRILWKEENKSITVFFDEKEAAGIKSLTRFDNDILWIGLTRFTNIPTFNHIEP